MKVDLNSYSAKKNNNYHVSGKFINRDLSWVDFNKRILDLAKDNTIPANERLNFLLITQTNLEEFLSVRFAFNYHNKVSQPYIKLLKKIMKFKRDQYDLSSSILSHYGWSRMYYDNVTKTDINTLRSTYNSKIYPLLTPINLSRPTFADLIKSGQQCIGVAIRTANDNIVVNAVPIPNEINHLYIISKSYKRFISAADLIRLFISETVFANKNIVGICNFKIIRDCDICLKHNSSKFMIERMEDVLNRRRTSTPIFMDIKVEDGFNIDNVEFESLLCDIFDIDPDHVFEDVKGIFDIKEYKDSNLFAETQSYPAFTPTKYKNIGNYDSLLDALRDGSDILLNHPYDSFDTVVKFIQHAAIDPNVVNIRQTLYRVSSEDSPIVNALCKAARNGKNVTVLVEIKARFDEQNNIALIRKLSAAGVCVISSFEYLKTHCKMCIIVRREGDDLKIYSHVGTGNYNEKTAKIYTDLSYLTSKKKIGNDLISVFNILSGSSTPDEKLQKIFYAPINLRKELEKQIDNEIKCAQKGKNAEIFIKVNSLSDRRIADKLYKAADAGVHIYILSRGICSIVPRKNLYIKSIVGRFLEHSRIYYFKNSDVYISSADLLTRNLDKRVEILISLKDSNVVSQIKSIINILKKDTYNSFEMDEDGKYIRKKGSFNSQEHLTKTNVSGN